MTNPPGSRLTTVFQIAATFAILVYLFTSGAAFVQEVLAATKLGPHTDVLAMASYTNVEAAHITLTNKTGVTAWGCMKGVVTSTATGNKVESHMVCTGEVKPHSTVVLEAPYRVGSVLELCNKTAYGDTKVVDWSKCSYELVDMTASVAK